MTRPKLPPKTAYHHLAQVLRDLEADLRWGLEGSARIPAAWHALAQEAPAPAKVKVTLGVDEDVLAFFRSMGRGHLTRMNAALRAFMLARLAEVVKATPDYAPTLDDEARAVRRELLDLVAAQRRAEEAAQAALSEGEKQRQRLEDLKRLRDARRGAR